MKVMKVMIIIMYYIFSLQSVFITLSHLPQDGDIFRRASGQGSPWGDRGT